MPIPAYREIPGTNFVVDAFRYRPISQDKVYFLTHAHSDHYGGLTENWSGGPIYCSEITARLVHLLTGVPVHLLRPTPLDVTTVIDGVKVTFTDANHCPGAAQVLFELQDGRRFIHCGDMRYSPALLNNPHLQRFRNADAVFLDTTYAHPRHAFPEQEEAVEFVAARIHQLLQEDEQDHAAAPASAGQTEPQKQPSVQHDPGTPMVSHPLRDAESTERALQEQQEVKQPQHDGSECDHGQDGCRTAQQQPEEGACQQQEQAEWQEQQQQQPPAADQPQQETSAVDAEDDEEQVQQAQQQLGFRRLYLISTYVIGKERLLLSVAARTGRKLLVTQRKLRLLRATGLSAAEVDAAFTTDPTSTPIRVVRWGHLGDSWPYFRPNFTNMEADRTAAGAQEVVGFVPTGWTYEMRKAAAAGGPYPFPVRTKAACSVWLVPYSEHSSFPELREYVGFLKPKQVIPTVGVGPDGPEADKKCAAILKHFRGLLDETANKAAFIARLGDGAAAKAGAAKPEPLGRIGSTAAGSSKGTGAARATAAAAAQEAAGAGAVVDLVSDEDDIMAGTPVGGNARCGAAAGRRSAAQGADVEGFWELDADLAAATCADVFSAAATTGPGSPAGDTEAIVQEPSARQGPAAAAATAAGAAAVQDGSHAVPVGFDAARGATSTAAGTAEPEAADVQLLQSLAPAGSLSVAEAQQLLAAAGGDLNAAVNALLDRQAQQQQQQQRSHASVGKKRPYSIKGSEAAITAAAAASGGTSSSKKPRRQQKKGSPAAPGQAAITAFFTSSRAKSSAQHTQQEPTVAPVQQIQQQRKQVPQRAAPKHQQKQQQQEQEQPDQGPADLQQHTKQEVGQQEHPKPSATSTAAAASAADAASSVPRIVLPPLRKLSLHSQSRQRSQQQQRGLQQQQQDDQVSAQHEQVAAVQHDETMAATHWCLNDQQRQQQQQQPDQQQQEVQHWQVPSASAETKQQPQIQQQQPQPHEQQESAAAPRAMQEGAASAAAWQALLPGNRSQRRRAGASSSTPVPASAPTKQAADSGQKDSAGPQLVPNGVPSAAPAPAAAGGAAPGGSLSITSSADVVPAALRQATLLPLDRYHPVDHAVWVVNQPAPYLALAVTLAAVDSTTKRNQIALGMTNFFRSLMLLSPQDVVPAAYLLCGRIGPEYESLELNIGGSVVSSALCEVCGVSRSQLSDMYKQHGDLGDVAQACRRKQTLLQAPQPLTISGFFEALHKLAAMSGQGATARRQAVVSKLLRAARDVETRYLVRTLIQCLRVGAGYRSVLPPLAKAALLHRSMLAKAANKAETSPSALDSAQAATPVTAAAHAASSVRHVSKAQLDAASAAVLAAYHRCPNIRVIADVLMSSGPEALHERVQLSCGVPVKPMLARPCTGAADALKLLSGTTAAGAAAAASGRVRPAQAAAAAAAKTLQEQQQDTSDGGDDSGDEIADGSDEEFEPAAVAVAGQHSTSSTATPAIAAAGAGAPSGGGSAAGNVQGSAAASRNHSSSSSSFCVLAEYKYDGQRAQIHVSADRQVRIFSRSCDEHTGAFPDVIQAVLAAVDPQQLPVVLDAELVAVDRANGNRPRAFQELATRRRGSAAASATAPPAAAAAVSHAAGTAEEAAGSRARGTKRPAAAAGLQAAGSRSGGGRKVQQQKLWLQPAAAPSSSMQQSASTTEVSAASTAAADTQDGAQQQPQQPQQEDTGSMAAGKAGQASGGAVDVCVFVFDALCVAGRDLMSHSLRQRRAAAAAALTRLTPGVVQLAQGIEVQVAGSAGAPAPAVTTRSGPSAVAAAEAAEAQQHVDELPGYALHHLKAAEVGAGSASAAAAGCEPPAAEGSDGAAGGAAGSSWAAAEQQLTEFLFSALDGGTEGLMLKLLDGPASGYAPAQRGLSWLKLKRDYLEGLADSLDLVPIGAWWGQGRKVKWFSPFLLAVYDRHTETFQSLCRVMSGFSDAFYAAATERLGATAIPGPKPYYNTGESCSVWFEPTEVWEVRGADLSISPVHRAAAGLIHPDRGIGLRFPRFLRVRPDKSPEEASGPDLVQELYNKQSRRIHQD